MATSLRRPHSRGPRADTAWFLAGYGPIAGFLVLEAFSRKPGTASKLTGSSDDDGTTALIITTYALAATLPPLLRRVPVSQLPRMVGPIGLALQTVGLGLRAWSMRTLGTSYTRTLRADVEQRVVTTGPYRWVRHPGYTGSLLIWTGFALASRSVPAIALVTALLARAYQRRIAAEEQLLQRELPGYTDYSHHTKRLVPYIW